MQSWKIQKKKLESGVQLINIQAPFFPYIIHSLWFRAGSRFDPVGKEGLAHFFEHLLGARTKKHPVNIDRLKSLEEKGIDFTAFTTHETAHYSHACLPETSDAALQLLIEGINEPYFSSEAISKERNIILDERARNHQDPAQYIWRLSQQALWPESNLGRDLFGTEQTIESVSPKDAIDFFEKYYGSNNTTFLTIGNNDIEHLEEIVSQHYKLRAGEVSFGSCVTEKPFKRLLVEERDIERVTLAINFRLLPNPSVKEKIAMDLLLEVMASGWISYLIQELRVKRDLTYWVDGFSEYFSDTGYVRFTFSVNKKNLTEAIDVVRKTLESLVKEPVHKHELDVYKRTCTAWLTRRYSGNLSALLYWTGWRSLVENDQISFPEYLKLLQQVTVQDVQQIAQKYLNQDNMSFVAIGPLKEEEISFT